MSPVNTRNLLAATIIAGAMDLMARRLIGRAMREPDFPDEFDKIADEVIREIKNAFGEGVSVDDEADAMRNALEQLEQRFADWRRQIRE